MRTKEDIWMNQCDACGEIEKEGELVCGYEGGKWDGLALCHKCQEIDEIKQEEKN